MHHHRSGVLKHLLFISAPTVSMLLYGFWPWPTFLRGGWCHSMKHLFVFQRVHSCSITDMYHPILRVYVNVCVCIGYIVTVDGSQHSHLDCIVGNRPNFSIHRHKRKLTSSLCLSSATLTLKHTVRLKVMAVDGHFWKFSYAMPP